jgi:molybdenum cofactor synthesis domain-containing protein
VTGRFRAGVLTISDRAHAGSMADESGPAAVSLVEGWGWDVERREIVPDDREVIAGKLRDYADRDRLHLVLTSGGTGFAPRDVTPEATRAVLEREAPGISELARSISAATHRFAALSRGVSGIRGKTVIVNLPGSPRGVREYLEILAPVLAHAVRLASGETPDHGGGPAPGGGAGGAPA